MTEAGLGNKFNFDRKVAIAGFLVSLVSLLASSVAIYVTFMRTQALDKPYVVVKREYTEDSIEFFVRNLSQIPVRLRHVRLNLSGKEVEFVDATEDEEKFTNDLRSAFETHFADGLRAVQSDFAPPKMRVSAPRFLLPNQEFSFFKVWELKPFSEGLLGVSKGDYLRRVRSNTSVEVCAENLTETSTLTNRDGDFLEGACK